MNPLIILASFVLAQAEAPVESAPAQDNGQKENCNDARLQHDE
jgi:hypothetical protein